MTYIPVGTRKAKGTGKAPQLILMVTHTLANSGITRKQGQGTYTTAGGDTYVGGYRDSKKHGQGTYTYANGNKYVGKWKKGSYHGQGTLTYADGKVEEGIWENGYLKNSITTTSGTAISLLPKYPLLSKPTKDDNPRRLLQETTEPIDRASISNKN